MLKQLSHPLLQLNQSVLQLNKVGLQHHFASSFQLHSQHQYAVVTALTFDHAGSAEADTAKKQKLSPAEYASPEEPLTDKGKTVHDVLQIQPIYLLHETAHTH